MSARICLLSLCLLMMRIDLQGQQHQFNVLVAGKRVGHLIAEREFNLDQTYIKVETDAKASILWKRYEKVSFWELVFQGNLLIKSSTVSYFNEELEDSVTLELNHTNYHGYLHPDKQIILNSPIHLTTSNLFFSEPVDIDSVYSERFLKYCRLHSDGSGKYILYLPDGTINHYVYSNSSLEEILIDRPWLNLRIRRQE